MSKVESREREEVMLDENCGIVEFKLLLGAVIAVIKFVEVFKIKYNTYQRLKDDMAKFSSPNNHGGINQLASIRKISGSVAGLIELLSKVKKSVSDEQLHLAAALCGTNVSTYALQMRNSSAINELNKLRVCQYFINEKFPAINDFEVAFTTEEGNVHPSFEAYAISKDTLKEVEVRLVGERKLAEVVKPSPVPSNYLIHYLNLDKEPLVGSLVLEWEGDLVVSAVITQQQNILGGGGIVFKSLPNGVIHPGANDPIFITLRSSESQSSRYLYQHLTLHHHKGEDSLSGTFSAVVEYSTKAKRRKVVSVSGSIFAQKVDVNPDLNSLAASLKVSIADFSRKTPPGKTNALTDEILRIRRGLQGKLISFSKSALAEVKSFDSVFQRYVGIYKCYYMRLSIKPPKFQTSFITVFPDGSASLVQFNEEEPITGHVCISENRLWFYFGYNKKVEKSPIRFVVEETTVDGKRRFTGNFQSVTIGERRIVSGLMSMTRIDPHLKEYPTADMDIADQNSKFLNVPFNNVLRGDFFDTHDFDFFTKGIDSDLDLTDGGAWNEVRNRLQINSAVDVLRRLCGFDPAQPDIQVDNHFYYYTFKKETPDEIDFVIERNLVTFYANGRVKISGSVTHYEGYVYQLKNTLRLSMHNSSSGFLEAFFELDDDKNNLADVKILYGASLWHSTKRIQAKTVVLTRLHKASFEEKPALFRFGTDSERKDLLLEDDNGYGVISYLRGEVNRYLHSTTESSTFQFRPRDRSFREMHFFIACFHGYRIKAESTDQAPREFTPLELGAIKEHLTQAFIHGFAVQFAGFDLDFETTLNDPSAVREKYSEIFLAGLTPEKKLEITQLEKTKKILERIVEIAEEQKFLQSSFVGNGSLAHDVLRNHAVKLWPSLLEKEIESE